MLHNRVILNKVRIRSTGSHVPAKIVPNEDLTRRIATDPNWILENLGIMERRVAEEDEFTSDLAAAAGLAAIRNAGLDKDDIDMLIVATATPDRKAPSTACIVQEKMGITNNCPAFDIAAVCSGFLYALTIAAQFIESGVSERALIIGADTFSKITDWDHRNCVFFGDGAGAVVVERMNDGGGLYSSLLLANGRGKDHFTVYPKDRTFTMNGRAVYETAITVLPETIRNLLSIHGLTTADISMIIPHQPSVRVLRKTAEVLDVPFGKIKTNMQGYANTAGATIPLLLDEVHQRGEIQTGDMIVFAAVGSGWTWGAALYRWV